MRRLLAAAVLCAALIAALVAGGSATADPAGQPAPPQTTTTPPARTVTKTVIVRPKRQVTRRHRFIPWARPTVRQVHFIIGYEAAMWGASASHLSSRIACESGYGWSKANGQYHGLGQFAESTFWRGYRSIHTRRVRLERMTRRRVPARVVRYWSDGSVTRSRGRRVTQRVRHVSVGRFPLFGMSSWHGWAQVRIMAQAMVGRSAVHDSEWQCR